MRFGASRVVDTDNFEEHLASFDAAEKAASDAGAKQALREARSVFDSDGDGTWENRKDTIRKKRHGKPMLGFTASLRDGLTVTDAPKGNDKHVGFPDEPHPDTEGRLTVAEVGLLHEHGDFPWLSKVADNPQREAAVMRKMRAAYTRTLTAQKPAADGDGDGV